MKKQMSSFFSILMGVAMATAGLSGQAQAIPFTATGGSLAASADFTLNGPGTVLTVVLTNTSLADVLVPADVLTAVFFSSNGTLAPASAILSLGSAVVFDAAPVGGVVGGEWAYGSGLAGAPGGATQGISSAGHSPLFGAANFAGPNLDGPVAVNGMQYGILSAGDINASGNLAVTGPNPFIQNSVTFTLNVDPNSGFSLSSINNVSFQYGTELSEPNIRVPEPASLMLLGAGLAAIGIWRRKATKG